MTLLRGARLGLIALAFVVTAAPGAQLAPDRVSFSPRAEVPWTVVAFALPSDAPPPPEAWMLAALLDERGALDDVGGHVEATSEPDGLIVVAEGPAEHQDLVLRAALSLLEGDLDAQALPRAQARALRRRVLDGRDVGKQARAALWRAWFGEGAPEARLVVDEMQVIRMELSALEALRARLAAAPGQALFVEGRADPARFAEAGARLAHSGLEPAPVRSPAPGPARVVLPLVGAAPRLLLGHPLPPAPELDGPFGLALVEAVRPAAESVGGAVELSLHRGAALLVFDVPLEGRAPDDVEAALARALEGLRGAPPAEKALAPLLDRARARIARERAELGQTARARARRYLVFGDRPPGPETPAALRELLRLALLPEALRSVLVEPAPLP